MSVFKRKTVYYRLIVTFITSLPIVYVFQRYVTQSIVLQSNASDHKVSQSNESDHKTSRSIHLQSNESNHKLSQGIILQSNVANHKLAIKTIGWAHYIPVTSPHRNMFYRIPYGLEDTASELKCHFVNEGNSLPLVEDITPPPDDSIFFFETSCKGGLNSRQACSVESAAKLHPNRNVYVFFSAPISDFVVKQSCISELIKIKNIKLARVNSARFAKGTALESLLGNRDNLRSKWPVQHTADMLRFITLYKYGGVYLDLDMLLVRPLDELGKNWVARQDSDVLNIAAIAMDRTEVGRSLTEKILKDLKMNFDPNEWTYNGPEVLKRSLMPLCDTSDDYVMPDTNCKGFQVYGRDKFYTVSYGHFEAYFTPGDLPDNKTEFAYGYHLWNFVSYNTKVYKNSPYEKLARISCPLIRSMFRNFFGT